MSFCLSKYPRTCCLSDQAIILKFKEFKAVNNTETVRKESVRPDWTIFKVLVDKFFYKNGPNVEQHFWAAVNNGIFSENCCGYFLGQLLDDFGQLFTPTSGHTG